MRAELCVALTYGHAIVQHLNAVDKLNLFSYVGELPNLLHCLLKKSIMQTETKSRCKLCQKMAPTMKALSTLAFSEPGQQHYVYVRWTTEASSLDVRPGAHVWSGSSTVSGSGPPGKRSGAFTRADRSVLDDRRTQAAELEFIQAEKKV